MSIQQIIGEFHKFRALDLTLRFEDTEDEKTNVIEKIADTFLTPVHFLLGGRTVHKDNRVHVLKQTYDYNSMSNIGFWLRTALAIALLIPSIIFGATLKGLSLLGSNRNSKLKLELSEIRPRENSHLVCDERYIGGDMLRPSEVDRAQDAELGPLIESQRLQKATLVSISEILNKHKLTWWVDCGTALGVYRHQGMIPWDTDIDISILREDHDNVFAALKASLDAEKYDVINWSSYDHEKSYIRIALKGTDSYIDIYHFVTEGDEGEKTVRYLFGYEKSTLLPERFKDRERACTKPVAFGDMFPLSRAQFDGIEVFVPRELEKTLLSKYSKTGNVVDLTPCKVWNAESRQLVKDESHPYWKQSFF